MRARRDLRRRMLAAGVFVALVLAVTLSGCGLGGHAGGGAQHRHQATSVQGTATRAAGATATTRAAAVGGGEGSVAASVAQANRTGEYPTPVPRERVVGGWRDPTAAIRAFAAAYINWTAQTVPRRMRALAEVSVGQARSAVTLAAQETADDSELRAGGIGNSGVVEAVAPVTGERDAYAVVTRERTSASADAAYQGLAPAWHVTIATVTRIGGGLWVLSGWQPQN